MPKYLQKKIKDERGVWIPVYGRTLEELDTKYKERQAEVERAKEMANNPFVWQYSQTWYNLYTKRLSDSRKSDYAIAINKHICPVIGELHMAEVTENDIVEIMTKCENLSRSSQDKIVCTLRKMFKAGKKSGVVKYNPCDDLKAGGDKPQEKNALTKAQMQILLDSVKDTPIEGFVLIGLYAGLRREEILGLKWDCVELEGEAPHIRVRRALRWKNNQPEVNEVLKSDAAYREIPRYRRSSWTGSQWSRRALRANLSFTPMTVVLALKRRIKTTGSLLRAAALARQFGWLSSRMEQARP